MFSIIWPIALVVLSNTLYQICAKSVPDTIDPFAALTVTYLTAGAFSTLLYCISNRSGNLIQEYSHLNWSSFALGLVIVGLEAGMIYAYKAGWMVSTLSIVQSAFLALALIVVGVLLYHEALSWSKALGVIICLIGLIFINR